MVIEKRVQRGSAHRSKTGRLASCVRFNDHNGLEHKFNRTRFQTKGEIGLYYDFMKRYEQYLRGGAGAGAGAGRKERLNYPRIAQSTGLEPLPLGFFEFAHKEKVNSLNKLCEKLVIENAPRIVEQDEVVQGVQDVGPQVYTVGKLEFDEGYAADLGPVVECHNDESSCLGRCPLQDAYWNQQGIPEGRPPTSYDEHADDFLQCCMSQFKLRACRYPDLLQECRAFEEGFKRLFQKLRDRELSILDEDLEVEPRSTHSRSRQREIHAQLAEDISGKDMLMELDKLLLMEGIGSQASNSGGDDVEHGVKNYVDTMPHVSAVCSHSSQVSSSGELPERSISEALKVAPIYMGRLKENEKEIHPPVHSHYMDWDLKYGNLMIEDMSLPVNYLQDWNKQFAGDYPRTMEQYGGNSPSQLVSPADQWNDPDIGHDIALWSTDCYPSHQQEDLMGMPILSHGHAT